MNRIHVECELRRGIRKMNRWIRSVSRWLYRVVVGGLFLAALLLSAETCQRLYAWTLHITLAGTWGAHCDAGSDTYQQWIDATVADAETPPKAISPGPEAPRRSDWFMMSTPEERAAFAKARQEVVWLCDGNGLVREQYVPDQPGALVEWAAEGAASQPFWDRFLNESVQINDARDTFASVSGGGSGEMREYYVSREGEIPYGIEFFIESYPNRGQDPELVTVFARESIYEVLWRRFRPYKYREDDTFLGWIVWTNNVGLRGPDITLPKPPGTYRIVCIGGSTTFEGPRNHLTYPAMLQKKFREHFKTDRIEVINGGVNGINSAGELGEFQNYLRLEPDLVVHYNFANDVFNAQYLVKEDEAAMGIMDRAVRAVARHSLLLKRQWPGLLIPPEHLIKDKISEYTIKNECDMMSQAEKAGVEWVSCSFACVDIRHLRGAQRRCFIPDYNSEFRVLGGTDCSIEYYWAIVNAYNELIKEHAKRTGRLYVPVAEELSSATECFSDVCHLYSNGIAKKADIIFEHLAPLVAGRLK